MLIKIHQNNHERKYLVQSIKTHIIQGPRSKSIREKKKISSGKDNTQDHSTAGKNISRQVKTIE